MPTGYTEDSVPSKATITWDDTYELRNLQGSTNSVAKVTYGIEFDAVLSETINRAAETATYPIEGGGLASDHIQPYPTTISLEVFVSDTPIRVPTTQMGDVQGSKQLLNLALRKYPKITPALPSARLITNSVAQIQNELPLPPRQRNQVHSTSGASLLIFDGGSGINRVRNVYDAVAQLMEDSIPLTITLDLAQWENVFLTNYNVPRTPTSGSGIILNLDFQQVIVAETIFSSRASREQSQKTSSSRSKAHAPRRARGPRPTTNLGGTAQSMVADGGEHQAFLESGGLSGSGQGLNDSWKNTSKYGIPGV